MNHLVSLAIPVRNGENFLEECLESVLRANKGRYKIVISNNCSTDGTAEILARFTKRTPLLRVVTAPSDLTLCENLNLVASSYNGTWIKFLCHDDLLFPEAVDRIEEALQTLATPGCALIGNSEVHLFFSSYLTEGRVPAIAPLDAEAVHGPEYLKSFFAGGPSVPSLTTACVRRDIFKKAGGFDLKWLHLDTFLWTRLLLDHSIIRVNNALTVNRIHGRQVAAQVRAVNRSTQEHREFWPGFLTELSEKTHVHPALRLKLRMKWISVAATDAAILSRKGRHGQAVQVLKSTGALAFPLAVAAYVRALGKEKKRVAQLRRHVTIEEIYPG